MADDKPTKTPMLSGLRSELNSLFIAKNNAELYRRDLEYIDAALGLDGERYFPDNSDRIKAIRKLQGK